MDVFDFSRVRDDVLLRDLLTHNGEEQAKSATVIAEIAEVDARRLYVPAGYTSMHAYCVHVLHLSEYAAYRRIQAARAGRRFPRIFQELFTGRLHLAAVCLLVPHLTPENANVLIDAAIHRTKADVEQWLVRRFPSSRSLGSTQASIKPITRVRSYSKAVGDLLSGAEVNADTSVGPGVTSNSPPFGADRSPDALPGGALGAASMAAMPTAVAAGACGGAGAGAGATAAAAQLAPGQVGQGAERTAGPLFAPTEVVERFQVCVTIDRAEYDRLRYAQALMSHSIPQGDVAKLLMRGVEMLIASAERRKLGSVRARGAQAPGRARHQKDQAAGYAGPKEEAAVARRRPGRNRRRDRYIPARIRRAVWNRDQGRCTFIGTGGHRCGARHRLEFDHVLPIARGGGSTLANLRLRCRAHNQHEAERSFGSDFMTAKREAGRRKAGKDGDQDAL